ncbi:uridine kinase [Microlunatus elymi]|uniref:Uridine kinase n=1 Tax=Microlunatus elymi TaxID=2596828 RepID=A0A516Q5B7_9ACTN|nr:uridine kinase [Microlunatus elymi]
MVLLAGPSGSGKSRVARLAECPSLNLDDFYFDADHPDLPHTLGIVDWDDPRTWDADAAVAAVDQLLRTGAAEVPRYDIGRSIRVGSHRVDLGDARCFVAEGVFAMQLADRCRAAGLHVLPLYLDRPRLLVMVLRFVRDLREHRKPLAILIRRGVALFHADKALRERATAAGFAMVSLRQSLELIRNDR